MLLLAALLLAGCAGGDAVRRSDLDAARQDSTRVWNLPDTDMLDHVIAASVHEARGDYMRALHEYNRALLLDSSYVELYHAAAEMHRKLGELESARLVLADGARHHDDRSLLEHLGEVQLEEGRYAEAAGTFRRVLQLDPNSHYALHNLAQAFERSGQVDSALSAYERLETMDFGDPEPLIMRRISLLSSQERFDEALELYEELREMKPGDDRIPFFLGGLYLDMGDTAKAADAVAAATHMRPVEERYWDMRLRLEIIMGHEERAVQLADSALGYNPGSADLHGLAASIFLSAELEEKARASLRRAIDLEPANPTHYINLGFLLHEEEQWEEAERLYQAAIKLAPGDAQVLNNYAYLLAEQGVRLEEALELSEDAVSMEPDNSSYLDTKGWILYRLGRLDEARTYLERALELSPHFVEILEHLEELYTALDLDEKAAEMDRRARQIEEAENGLTRHDDE